MLGDFRANLATGAHHSRVIELVPSGSTWVPSTLNPIPAGVVCPGNGGYNSAGGVDYDCDGGMFIMSDAIAAPSGLCSAPVAGPCSLGVPDQMAYVYGVQYNPVGTVGVPNAYLIDLNNNTTCYDKNFLGDVETYRCCCVPPSSLPGMVAWWPLATSPMLIRMVTSGHPRNFLPF